MRYLIDTCIVIWLISDPEKLSETSKQILSSSQNEIFLSPVTIGELACLSKKKSISINPNSFLPHWKKWLKHYKELNGWEYLPITPEIMEEAYSLPEDFHLDLSDRILVATSRIEEVIVLTADKKILQYPHVESVW